MAGKKITIEDLAKMINAGFEKTATKEQVLAIENRLEKVEKKMDHITKSLLINFVEE